MIAIDTNLLIYAHRAGVREHGAAQRAIEAAANDPRGWGISSPSVSEFWSIVTHPGAQGGPSRPSRAMAFMTSLMQTGGMRIWLPRAGFAARLMQLASDLQVTGVRIFDLQIGLTAVDNGAAEIWSHDTAFVRIPGLAVIDPLA
jgi:uncharacterized protein